MLRNIRSSLANAIRAGTLERMSLSLRGGGVGIPPEGLRDTLLVARYPRSSAPDRVQMRWPLVTALVVAVGLVTGERPSGLVWLGTLLYLVYAYVIYAMAVHFSQLFLVYVAVLGLSSYAVLCSVDRLRAADGDVPARPARRLAGWTSIAIGVLFTLLWLSELVPATVTDVWEWDGAANLWSRLDAGTGRDVAGCVADPRHVDAANVRARVLAFPGCGPEGQSNRAGPGHVVELSRHDVAVPQHQPGQANIDRDEIHIQPSNPTFSRPGRSPQGQLLSSYFSISAMA